MSMPASINDQVVDFYYSLFERLFSDTFKPRISERLKRDAVIRQVQEAAGAASQSLVRLFVNERVDPARVEEVLGSFASLGQFLVLENVSNPNVAPESLAEGLLGRLSCPAANDKRGALYRVALHSVVQVLMLVGPLMAEWQRLNFSSAFEMLRRVLDRLNQISQQLDALGAAGQSAADERYELTYRDYLLQRFYRVEAGTVRMTTNLNVDLRELFVMPRVLPRKGGKTPAETDDAAAEKLMNLAAARQFFGGLEGIGRDPRPSTQSDKEDGISALDQARRRPRNVIVGEPGSGKSTFLEWLQLQLAEVEEEFPMRDDKQAIPLLLRIRQLDPKKLPGVDDLIAKATGSQDRAALAPAGWLRRQMQQGRVLFMLDGLDETEPELVAKKVLPWLQGFCKTFPTCRYLISSRPVGYPSGLLRALKFEECDLLDFAEPEVAEYARHWCVAVRLARNEPHDEARREGAADGERIVGGFKGHPYIRNLARNPLMLSAICLVNYFEGGQLPKDRAVLYKLCVEGLLHHWDQRRGIHSEFSLDEKQRACREVALAMQADDRAEYEAEKVGKVFDAVLGDVVRAKKLLEHIRHRTGLLLERRAGIFAFAHLTFQEYLAARAVHEGNRLGITPERLAHDHGDGRWNEVIALYCGLAPNPAARHMVELLVNQRDTESLSSVLAEAYLSCSSEILNDEYLSGSVLERIAVAPRSGRSNLGRFPSSKVAQIANKFVGAYGPIDAVSEAHAWFNDHPVELEWKPVSERFALWPALNSMRLAELIHLSHRYSDDAYVTQIASLNGIYNHKGPVFTSGMHHRCQGEVALIGLADRFYQILARSHSSKKEPVSPGVDTALCHAWEAVHNTGFTTDTTQLPDNSEIFYLLQLRTQLELPQAVNLKTKFAVLARDTIAQLSGAHPPPPENLVPSLLAWADSLEAAMAKPKANKHQPAPTTTPPKRPRPKRRQQP